MKTENKISGNPSRLRKKALGILCVLVLAGSISAPTAFAAGQDDDRLQALERSNRQLRHQLASLKKWVRTFVAQGQADSANADGPAVSGLTIFEFEALKADVEELQDLLNGAERNGSNLVFNGMNLQVTSGSGATDGAVNGLGNIIIGYNEDLFPYLGNGPSSQKTGSHNLVVGKGNNYMSYGGIVSGLNNWIGGTYSSITGGERNQALGNFSSVFAGSLNQAAGLGASAGSGQSNAASGAFSTAFGGLQNVATGDFGSSIGGLQNQASGTFSATSSGSLNNATGVASGISGGLDNQAVGDYSNVNGGLDNTAMGIISSVGGGLGNATSGAISHVCGGLAQTAGDPIGVKCD